MGLKILVGGAVPINQIVPLRTAMGAGAAVAGGQFAATPTLEKGAISAGNDLASLSVTTLR
jgi:hypothetical protein